MSTRKRARALCGVLDSCTKIERTGDELRIRGACREELERMRRSGYIQRLRGSGVGLQPRALTFFADLPYMSGRRSEGRPEL